MKEKILTVLRQREDFVSGQELCESIGVSRTAVWKVIKQLKEEGYGIESVQNKGYCLQTSPDILEPSEVASRLHTKWAGLELHYLPVTGSTNADAKILAEQGAPHGMLVLADSQRGGRGRRGHLWQSPAGTTISMSLLCRPTFSPEKASMMTLVMGLAVADAIESMTGLETFIKWPNDIVIHQKKVTGILTEMSAEPDFIQYVIIGVGINVNSEIEAFEEDVRGIASSLKIESGKKISRAQLVAEILKNFESYYEKFQETLDLSGIMQHYNERLVNLHRQVKVLDPKDTFEGIARGIDAGGNLLVETLHGEITKVNAGEVSVRGLYGYV